MYKETFSILYFTFLINEEKEFRKILINSVLMKNINALRRWSTKTSKVGDKQSLLKFFLVKVLHRNWSTLEPDLLSS